MPILTGTDGVQKMSKSLGNYISISEPAVTMFEKVMRMKDDNLINYYTLLTDVSMDSINDVQGRLESHPDTEYILHCKKNLAKEITAAYHGEDKAEQAFDSYGRTDKAGLPELSLTNATSLSLVDWMVQAMGVSSKSNARRLIEQEAVRVNDNKIMEEFPVANFTTGDIIRIGKLKAFKLTD